MVEDFDVIEFLHRLAERSAELLDCAEAGLMLADAAGALRVMASCERSDALELLQSQNDEGPCFECYHRATPVISEDLAAETERWPRPQCSRAFSRYTPSRCAYAARRSDH
ncbi:MAG: hypothetical protein WKF33_07030 [Thermoleophilaceae bacterium]